MYKRVEISSVSCNIFHHSSHVLLQNYDSGNTKTCQIVQKLPDIQLFPTVLHIVTVQSSTTGLTENPVAFVMVFVYILNRKKETDTSKCTMVFYVGRPALLVDTQTE